MSVRIAIFGGSFNPPGIHHREIAHLLSLHFDRVIIVPCGPRPDKRTTNNIEPIFRATLADLNFRGLPNVEVDLFDLEQATFTRTHDLQDRYASQGDVWHVVGGDLIKGGNDGASFIQTTWKNGTAIWNHLNFAVITRDGIDFDERDLPPHHQIFHVQVSGASSSIRERIFNHQPIEELVTPAVSEYIERYELYRGRIPSRLTRFQFEQPRLLIVPDESNPNAMSLVPRFEPYRDDQNPNCILVIGGDGMMLGAISQYWHLRLPFFGVNAGHLGFLLNEANEVLNGSFRPQELLIRQMPLLYVEAQLEDGTLVSSLSFNDAWVERATSQVGWIEVKVNGRVKIPKLIADGALVSTAAGSTAYARAMGAMPLLADTPALLLVGSNVLEPPGWKSALLSLDSEVEFCTLSPIKRPLEGFAGNNSLGKVQKLRIRVSRIAAAELAFCPTHDMAEKIAQIQFPNQRG